MSEHRTTGIGRRESRLTLYEPRRRWWGGLRADIVLERLTKIKDTDMFINEDLAHTTWKPPHGWTYQSILLDEEDLGEIQLERVL